LAGREHAGVGEPVGQVRRELARVWPRRVVGHGGQVLLSAASAAYFADLAKRQWQHLTGQRREAALAAMTADIDNLRLAWRHWVGERDRVQLNKLVDSL
jgi:hypothetical protein